MVKYIFKSINLLIFSLTILFYSNLYSYENLNECKLTKDLIYKFKDKLSLDERFFEKVEGFGIDLDAFDDKYYLSKIHPDIIQKTGNKNLSVRSEVKEINGINLSELNKRSIEQLFKNDVIDLRLKKDDIFLNEKLDKSEFKYSKVKLELDIQKINNIDSKNSSFDIDFILRTKWNHDRISKLGKQIHKKAVEINSKYRNSYYFCDLDEDFINKVNFHIPDIHFPSFTINEIIKKNKIILYYYPPIFCNYDFEGQCNDDQKKDGITFFTQEKYYSGKNYQKFNFRKFPFDNQYLIVKVDNDDSIQWNSDGYEFTELNFTDENDQLINKSITNLNLNEWKVGSYQTRYGTTFKPESNVRIPILLIIVEVIRDYNYYIFKICLPILLILSVAWSALWLSPKEIETQVTITVVCLLSLIAYNFIIDKDLPKLSYLTFMDKFILTSYFYAGLPTFISIIGNNNLKKGKNIIVSRISFYSKTFIPISYILLIMLIYNLEVI